MYYKVNNNRSPPLMLREIMPRYEIFLFEESGSHFRSFPTFCSPWKMTFSPHSRMIVYKGSFFFSKRGGNGIFTLFPEENAGLKWHCCAKQQISSRNQNNNNASPPWARDAFGSRMSRNAASPFLSQKTLIAFHLYLFRCWFPTYSISPARKTFLSRHWNESVLRHDWKTLDM